jgi:N-acetylmuramoyl-L-alanine amidase
VQLAASPQLLDVTAGKWLNVPYLIEVVEETKLYKYQVRNFANLEEANLAKEKLRQVGFNDAFVVAYQNGKRVDPKSLVK